MPRIVPGCTVNPQACTRSAGLKAVATLQPAFDWILLVDANAVVANATTPLTVYINQAQLEQPEAALIVSDGPVVDLAAFFIRGGNSSDATQWAAQFVASWQLALQASCYKPSNISAIATTPQPLLHPTDTTIDLGQLQHRHSGDATLVSNRTNPQTCATEIAWNLLLQHAKEHTVLPNPGLGLPECRTPTNLPAAKEPALLLLARAHCWRTAMAYLGFPLLHRTTARVVYLSLNSNRLAASSSLGSTELASALHPMSIWAPGDTIMLRPPNDILQHPAFANHTRCASGSRGVPCNTTQSAPCVTDMWFASEAGVVAKPLVYDHLNLWAGYRQMPSWRTHRTTVAQALVTLDVHNPAAVAATKHTLLLYHHDHVYSRVVDFLVARWLQPTPNQARAIEQSALQAHHAATNSVADLLDWVDGVVGMCRAGVSPALEPAFDVVFLHLGARRALQQRHERCSTMPWSGIMSHHQAADFMQLVRAHGSCPHTHMLQVAVGPPHGAAQKLVRTMSFAALVQMYGGEWLRREWRHAVLLQLADGTLRDSASAGLAACAQRVVDVLVIEDEPATSGLQVLQSVPMHQPEGPLVRSSAVWVGSSAPWLTQIVAWCFPPGYCCSPSVA